MTFDNSVEIVVPARGEDPTSDLPATGREWWRNAIIYQIYPRSFADDSGDGIGDLRGITTRLPSLVELGVDAIWLSPFFVSPQRDAGYDVADYCDVDPLFGTLADFDALEDAAHALGLKIIVDLVPNHTSSDHAWFRAALDAEGYALVSIVSHGGQWHATLVDGRRVEHFVLGSVEVADELVRRIGSDLDALAMPRIPEQIRTSVRRSLRAGLAAVDGLMLGPMKVDGRSLVVSPSGSLAILPWGLLPSRRGLPVVVSPSASSWFAAVDRSTTESQTHLGGGPRVASIAGPGLTRADAEAGTIADTWSGTLMTGQRASTSAVTAVLGTHDVVHIAAHGRHEPDNPLFSSLRLADGPLFAHELDSTAQMASCVVLSACEVGLSTLRPGNEALGLTSALMQLGARSVLAGVARVADDLAADVMERMHRLMTAGADSATALARASVATGRDDEVTPFVCFGSSWTAPTASPNSVALNRN